MRKITITGIMRRSRGTLDCQLLEIASEADLTFGNCSMQNMPDHFTESGYTESLPDL